MRVGVDSHEDKKLDHAMNTTSRLYLSIPLVLALLAGCGGGGGGDCTFGALGCGSSAASNAPPVARISAPATATAQTSVTLDGSTSADPDGQISGYVWELTAKPAGSVATLTGATSSKATFVPDMAGSYVLKLTVQDNRSATASANVTIQASAPNGAPVVNAGADRSVLVNEIVRLDASASYDPDGERLSYRWSLLSPAGLPVVMSAEGTPFPTFVASMVGTYVAELVVSDGRAQSAPARVNVTVGSSNRSPVAAARALPSASVSVNSKVTLDGAGSSDPDFFDRLDYDWRWISRPTGSSANFSSSNIARPDFVADLAGEYVAQLTVTDPGALRSSVLVRVTATDGNRRPTAASQLAPIPQQVFVGENIVLDASASTDPDGDRLDYVWRLEFKPLTSAVQDLNGKTSSRPSFTPDQPGSYVASLRVTDGRLTSDPTFWTINASVRNAPVAPVARIRASGTLVKTKQTVILDAVDSTDANVGDTLSFDWTLVSIPATSAALLRAQAGVAGTAASTNQIVTLVPDVPGDYVVSLRAKDSGTPQLSHQISTVIRATNDPPVARVAVVPPAVAFVTTVGVPFQLDASTSSDPENDVPLSYAWAIDSASGGTATPTTASISILGGNAVKPFFTATAAGTYVVKLIVKDTLGNESFPLLFTIVVNP